jgi:hypothetical protein
MIPTERENYQRAETSSFGSLIYTIQDKRKNHFEVKMKARLIMKRYALAIGILSIALSVNIWFIGCSDNNTPIETNESIANTALTATSVDRTTTNTTSATATVSTPSQTITTPSSSTTRANTNWNLSLVGVITENVNQTLFAQGAAPGCHAAFWTDAGGQLWSGIQLWLLAAYVDDNSPMGAPNEALWKQGFEVQIISSDGSTVEYSSVQIENNNNIIVAYQMDGEPLPNTQWPLALAGSGVDQQHQIGAIATIKLIIPSITTNGLSSTP